jgi:hypothetical protein
VSPLYVKAGHKVMVHSVVRASHSLTLEALRTQTHRLGGIDNHARRFLATWRGIQTHVKRLTLAAREVHGALASKARDQVCAVTLETTS